MSTLTQEIDSSECLSTSINTINNNFSALEQETCALQQFIKKQINTFFFYGPNSDFDPDSGHDPLRVTRPSNEVITNFVNSPNQLNLIPLTRVGDTAYVIYQKTGFKNNLFLDISPEANIIQVSREAATAAALKVLEKDRERILQQYLLELGSISSNTKRRYTRLAQVFGRYMLQTMQAQTTYNANSLGRISEDIVNDFVPIFFIWKLTYRTGGYSVDDGFPKITQAFTSTTGAETGIPWNDPRLWNQY